jgi:biopolymer transport protein ExbB
MMSKKFDYKKRNPVTILLMVGLLTSVLCPLTSVAEASKEEAPPPAPLVTTAPVEYTVEAGDTLMGLARKAYGTSDDWRQIYDANKEVIFASGGLKEGLVVTLPLLSSEVAPQQLSFEKPMPPQGTFEHADATVQQQLETSLAELAALREKLVMEKIPLSRKLSDLEDELSNVRKEYQQTTRLLDSRTLDLSNLNSEIKSRTEEKTYLSNLLSEYIRNFESRLHIAELQRYKAPLETAKLAPENSNLSALDVFHAQTGLITASLDRLHDALGGTRFAGTAVDAGGLVKQGEFILIGPAALFRSEDGKSIGTAEQRLGSLEPAVIAFESASDTKAAARLVEQSAGDMPFDPTLGNAHMMESTKESLWEHIRKGGLTMIPILGLAAAALLVALYKFAQLSRLKSPTEAQSALVLNAVAAGDAAAAAEAARSINGPAGDMLVAGIEHINEPRELVEEVMFEKVLSAKLKLESLLPFIAISASSAPLLGLLGTVTGIINTFKLITVFGSGDVKSLSGGISEALITTEYGLIVAIPSLLLHAFLSRQARGMIDKMEKCAVSFINQLTKTPYRRAEDAE